MWGRTRFFTLTSFTQSQSCSVLLRVVKRPVLMFGSVSRRLHRRGPILCTTTDTAGRRRSQGCTAAPLKVGTPLSRPPPAARFSTLLLRALHCSQMFRGQTPLWLTGGDYCCQPHIRGELNGRESHPPRAPYNSAFVRYFTVFLFPFLTNLLQEQLCLGRNDKKTKGGSWGGEEGCILGRRRIPFPSLRWGK